MRNYLVFCLPIVFITVTPVIANNKESLLCECKTSFDNKNFNGANFESLFRKKIKFYLPIENVDGEAQAAKNRKSGFRKKTRGTNTDKDLTVLSKYCTESASGDVPDCLSMCKQDVEDHYNNNTSDPIYIKAMSGCRNNYASTSRVEMTIKAGVKFGGRGGGETFKCPLDAKLTIKCQSGDVNFN